MEEAYPLSEYLPIEFYNKEHKSYVSYLWDGYKTNYEGGSFSFAYLAIHMLYMTVIYSMLLKVKYWNPEHFDYALIGFRKGVRNGVNKGDTLFCFNEIKSEAVVVDFLRLLDFDYSQIGEFKTSIKKRNEIAHPNGQLTITNQATADFEIEKLIGYLDQIHQKFSPIIEDLLIQLLEENWNQEDFKHDNHKDEIREIIFPAYGFSLKDMEIIREFDITRLVDDPNFEEIEALFDAILNSYEVDESEEILD